MEDQRRKTDQLERMLKEHIFEEESKFSALFKMLEHNTTMTEGIIQQNSGTGSDVKELRKAVTSLEQALANYKFGWNVFKYIGGVTLALLLYIWALFSKKVGL